MRRFFLIMVLPYSILLVFSSLQVALALGTVLRFDPSIVVLGPDYCVGETFTLAARIDDVEDLCAFAFKIKWNTSYLEYVDHVVTIPVETYPGGVLHEPVLIAVDTVNVTEGWYFVDAGIIGFGGSSFYGSGTAFEITFNVTQQPKAFEEDVLFRIGFTIHVLDPSTAGNIAHLVEHCNVTIHPYWSPADINDDLKVDIYDIVLGANAYGSIPGDPNWNPDCDIAEPYDVIDISDVVMIVDHYGEEYGT